MLQDVFFEIYASTSGIVAAVRLEVERTMLEREVLELRKEVVELRKEVENIRDQKALLISLFTPPAYLNISSDSNPAYECPFNFPSESPSSQHPIAPHLSEEPISSQNPLPPSRYTLAFPGNILSRELVSSQLHGTPVEPTSFPSQRRHDTPEVTDPQPDSQSQHRHNPSVPSSPEVRYSETHTASQHPHASSLYDTCSEPQLSSLEGPVSTSDRHRWDGCRSERRSPLTREMGHSIRS